MGHPLEKYAKRKRAIRSLQPKVSSDTAYAQARKAQEAAAKPPPAKARKSSTGRGGKGA